MVSCSGGVGETLRASEPVEEKVGREEVGDCHHDERRTVIACITHGVAPGLQCRVSLGFSRAAQRNDGYSGDGDDQ